MWHARTIRTKTSLSTPKLFELFPDIRWFHYLGVSPMQACHGFGITPLQIHLLARPFNLSNTSQPCCLLLANAFLAVGKGFIDPTTISTVTFPPFGINPDGGRCATPSSQVRRKHICLQRGEPRISWPICFEMLCHYPSLFPAIVCQP